MIFFADWKKVCNFANSNFAALMHKTSAEFEDNLS